MLPIIPATISNLLSLIREVTHTSNTRKSLDTKMTELENKLGINTYTTTRIKP